ncbi:hypothetical protein ACHAXS_006808 [Conticribra weissflogii]
MSAVNIKTSIFRKPILFAAFLSILVHFLWSILDANPALFFYDAYLTLFTSSTSPPLSSLPLPKSSPSSSLHLESGNVDIDDHRRRRIFRHVTNKVPNNNANANANNIEGKTIWITGASSGIGAELAIQLSGAGVKHLILSGRQREKLEIFADSCRRMGQEWRRINVNIENNNTGRNKHDHLPTELQISIVPFDMSDPDPAIIENAVNAALQLTSPSGIDTLVLNAGQYQLHAALETPDPSKSLFRIMQVNFLSPTQLAHRLIHMDHWRERSRGGHVVLVNSLMGIGSAALNAAYVASKHSARGYFHTLAAEEATWLRVDVVCPGATDTGLWGGSLTLEREKEREEQRMMVAKADDRSKMSVERCARLIVSSMLGPNFFFFETYITRNPGLLWVYLASREPTLFRVLNHYFIAPLRLGLWRKDGSDPLYLPTLLGYSWEIIWSSVNGVTTT